MTELESCKTREEIEKFLDDRDLSYTISKDPCSQQELHFVYTLRFFTTNRKPRLRPPRRSFSHRVPCHKVKKTFLKANAVSFR